MPLNLQQTGGGGGGASTWDTILSAANNLTLNNAAFTTTFNQTSAVAWTWANTTAATSSGSGAALVVSGTARAHLNSGQVTLNTTGATLLVAILTNDTTAGTPPTITDSLGNTWNYLPTYGVASGSAARTLIAYAYSNGGGALSTGSDTFTIPTTHFDCAVIFAFSGTLTTSAVYDGVQTGGFNLGTPTAGSGFYVGTGIPPVAGDLIISGVGSNNSMASATVSSTGSSETWSTPVTQGNNADETGSGAYILSASGNPVNPFWTGATSASGFNGVVACFRPANIPVTAQSSPIFNIGGKYWNGASSATDAWTITHLRRSCRYRQWGARGCVGFSSGIHGYRRHRQRSFEHH